VDDRLSIVPPKPYAVPLAKKLNYGRFKALVEKSPYFSTYFPYNKNVESSLLFPRRIGVTPVSGEETAIIGQNVFGGVIDEINYMERTANSKKSVEGGDFDQANALYDSIVRRRKSRFNIKGSLPGVLCIVSSKRYPGQFTDVKEEQVREEIKKTGSSKVYIYDKRIWDIVPDSKISDDWFRVFVGTLTDSPRILEDDEESPSGDPAHVMKIPLEYRTDFERDIMNALREIAGVSTLARYPYFTNASKVAAAFKPIKSVLSRQRCVFDHADVELDISHVVNPNIYRWAHIDLAISGDSAGLAIGHVPSFTKPIVGTTETMPRIHYDALLEIAPPINGEINFGQIRKILYNLRDMGLHIRWVTLDSFQSRDTIQILRTKGFQTGLISLDRDNVGYDILKSAIYEDRVSAPKHTKCQLELTSLEKDILKAKVDHPVMGSKDVSDAMAGVARGLTLCTEIWLANGIAPYEVPDRVLELSKRTPLG